MKKIVLLLALVSLFACSSRESQKPIATSVPAALEAELQPGAPIAQRILSEMGQPFKVQKGKADRRLLTYRLTSVRNGPRRYWLFGKRRMMTTVEYAHFLFQQEILIRYWRDAYLLVPPSELNYRLGSSKKYN